MNERLRRCLALAALAGLSASPLAHAELELAGFGTLGGAVSDQDFGYQRDITDDGTLNRDSVIGFQIDAHLTPAWGATIQGKAAPSDHRDNGWDPVLTWAFVSWRPTNDVLVRAGKLRIPLMLYSATGDVGVTYPFARLPTEVYSLSPVTDATGLSATWSWLSGDADWTLEGYGGRAHTNWRFYLRDGLSPYLDSGASYVGADADLGGLVLTLRRPESTWKVGVHRVNVEANFGAFPVRFPYVSLAPGVGYYQVLDVMPGPGIPRVNTIVNNLLTVGAEISLPHDFRLTGEYARRQITNMTNGADTQAAYLALLRPVGPWTPYAYVAGIRSRAKALDLYKALNGSAVPAAVPNAELINDSQRFGADRMLPFDQYSFAVGASYKLTRNAKLKGEWSRTRSGVASSFFDVAAGEDSGDREANVFSLSCSFTF